MWGRRWHRSPFRRSCPRPIDSANVVRSIPPVLKEPPVQRTMAASMARPIQTSDIIFPVLSSNLSETLSSLKRSALSITNRLRSIAQDAEFVCSVAEAYGLPLVANERCGSWYIPPDRKGGSAYFKSTDGHAGEWSFSLRRLNTQVLDIVGRRDG